MGKLKETHSSYDVAIIGAGMAGLCLARQLAMTDETLSIAVVEPSRYPVPIAAHKVGESTVEIGAHYLAHTLQLKEYLDQHHLKKFGLRCYFGDSKNISSADELGASQSLPVSSYQIDRGMLENHLAETLQSQGVMLHSGCRVTGTVFAEDGSGTVSYSQTDKGSAVSDDQLSARWVVDASGRRGLFRREFGLKQSNELNGNAAWFRVDEQIKIDEWSTDVGWHQRINCGERWLSTNHLMGHGYWVWLIPLGSGATSVGIVTDASHHKVTNFTSFDRSMAWLGKHQSQCADALSGVKPMDYAWLRNYSYGCSEIFSRQSQNQRWALTGEAGLFLDPFYSPGTDFIAYSNTFIVDLIVRDRRGENIRKRQLLYQQTYQSIYESSLLLYENQYEAFGNFRLMSIKTVWDYAYYWGVLGLLFFNEAITDLELLNQHWGPLNSIRQRHRQLQQSFYDAALNEPVMTPTGSFTDHFSIPLLHRLNSELADRVSGAALSQRFGDNLDCLHQLADEIERIVLNSNKHGANVSTGASSSSTPYLPMLATQFAS